MKLELIRGEEHKDKWFGVYVDDVLEKCCHYLNEDDKEVARKVAQEYYDFVKGGKQRLREIIISEQI